MHPGQTWAWIAFILASSCQLGREHYFAQALEDAVGGVAELQADAAAISTSTTDVPQSQQQGLADQQQQLLQLLQQAKQVLGPNALNKLLQSTDAVSAAAQPSAQASSGAEHGTLTDGPTSGGAATGAESALQPGPQAVGASSDVLQATTTGGSAQATTEQGTTGQDVAVMEAGASAQAVEQVQEVAAAQDGASQAQPDAAAKQALAGVQQVHTLQQQQQQQGQAVDAQAGAVQQPAPGASADGTPGPVQDGQLPSGSEQVATTGPAEDDELPAGSVTQPAADSTQAGTTPHSDSNVQSDPIQASTAGDAQADSIQPATGSTQTGLQSDPIQPATDSTQAGVTLPSEGDAQAGPTQTTSASEAQADSTQPVNVGQQGADGAEQVASSTEQGTSNTEQASSSTQQASSDAPQSGSSGTEQGAAVDTPPADTAVTTQQEHGADDQAPGVDAGQHVIPRASAEPELPPHQWVSGQAVKCPDGCTTYGTCNEELGRCDCPKHMMGPDCGTPAPPALMAERCAKLMYGDVDDCVEEEGRSCLNACNNRGNCTAGFCHCKPGYFGADCSLSLDEQGKAQLLGGSGYQTRQKRPWVYVYELPPHLTSWMNHRRLDRPTAHMFWQRLLSSGARTADPDKADWFFIPIRQRGWGDKAHLREAIEYISSVWPFWNQTQGQRHFLFATGDLGVADMDPVGRQMAENVTWLSYWGLTQRHNHSGWEPAHRPGKDVVIPVLISSGHYAHIGMNRSPLHPLYKGIAENGTSQFRLPTERDKVFFFAGRVCTNRALPDNSKPPPFNCGPREAYSGGVRQAVYYYYANRTDWTVKLSERNYPRALASHRFCLAPLGGGHGQRQVVVSTMGCIPVTIGDNVLQPFEPELPWSEFAVQVAEADVPQLHTVLEGMSPEELARKQAALRCAAQHMVWSSLSGGYQQESGKYDAFETILEILRMKVQYPDAKPEEYQQLDEAFRRFMACGAEKLGDPIPPPPDPNPLCTHSWLERQPPSCYECIRGVSPTHGMPGGIICCGSKRDLSKCPRLWD